MITSRGKIENTGSIKLIKSNMDGNILDIFFREGQKVEKDALLIKSKTTFTITKKNFKTN